MLCTLGKNSADNILKYFSYFYQKTGFDISCKLSPVETICMKCQSLFSEKDKKNVINLSSAESAQRVVKVKMISANIFRVIMVCKTKIGEGIHLQRSARPALNAQ